MKSLIKGILKKIATFLPKWAFKNYIVFESAPDCADNTMSVFNEMVKRGLTQKYKLIWLVQNKKHKLKKIGNVKLVSRNSLLKNWYIMFSKCLISCNQMLRSCRQGQYSIYLGHGIPIKSIRAASPEPVENVDNWVVMSENTKELFSYEFNMPIEKGIALGYPRNDEFYATRTDLHKLFDVDFTKAIVWYPTFRQNQGGVSASDSDVALPIIHNAQNAIELNKFAKQYKVLIIVKPHFAQDISFMLDLDLPYIKFINDEFLFDNKLSSYKFVNGCDALLTDYSSIYFDFLLANRPIGLTWEDYCEYSSRPGFAIDMKKYMIGGVKIYTLEDLKSFLFDVSQGIDTLNEERQEVRKMIHEHDDGKSSERVVEHIVRNLSKKNI